jgi:hypothetical protein
MAVFNFIYTDLGLKRIENNEEFDFAEFAGSDPSVSISEQLGTPVMSNIVFDSGSYTDRDTEISFDGLQLDTALITANQSKNIIKTQVQGRRGSVKEYISEGDFAINIKAVIVSPDSEIYPADEVRKFIELMRAPVSLSFQSEFIDRIGAFDLVVESYSMPQTEGFRNVQAVSINCISDNPLEIKVREEEKITRLTSESEKTIFETVYI